MRRYERFDPEWANYYDEIPRWLRITLYLLACVVHRRWPCCATFNSIELAIGEHSLRRKLNKLRHMGMLDGP